MVLNTINLNLYIFYNFLYCYFQEDFNKLRVLSYINSDVFLVCFSVANPESFTKVQDSWVPELRHYIPDTPFILVGTQVDIRQDKMDRQVNKYKQNSRIRCNCQNVGQRTLYLISQNYFCFKTTNIATDRQSSHRCHPRFVWNFHNKGCVCMCMRVFSQHLV